MARPTNIEKMSYSELLALREDIDRLMVHKQAEEKEALKQKLADMAKSSGFSLEEIVGKASRRGNGKGSVAVKYRDPKNSANTWTGRGRMPRWMVAATKVRGVKKDDFLI